MKYRNREIEPEDFNDTPIYYTSVAGNIYVTRIKDTDAQTGVLSVVDYVDFGGKTDLTITEILPGFNNYDTSFEQTIKHNFGKYTYPMGHMSVGDNYFPLPFKGEPGFSATATYVITKNALTIKFSSTVLTEVQDVKARVYLLRETMD